MSLWRLRRCCVGKFLLLSDRKPKLCDYPEQMEDQAPTQCHYWPTGALKGSAVLWLMLEGVKQLAAKGYQQL